MLFVQLRIALASLPPSPPACAHTHAPAPPSAPRPSLRLNQVVPRGQPHRRAGLLSGRPGCERGAGWGAVPGPRRVPGLRVNHPQQGRQRGGVGCTPPPHTHTHIHTHTNTHAGTGTPQIPSFNTHPHPLPSPPPQVGQASHTSIPPPPRWASLHVPPVPRWAKLTYLPSPPPPRWAKLTYLVFDAPQAGGGFAARLTAASAACGRAPTRRCTPAHRGAGRAPAGGAGPGAGAGRRGALCAAQARGSAPGRPHHRPAEGEG
jgi:hypothetical protein